ncbi:MAG: hypothetical protein PWP63_1341 [Methanolobus sp.]|jgi:hypothetical protein|nr:hypothetical protein [Methanolobus sp.]
MMKKGWTSVFVKESTRDRIKQEADATGMKMYALIDQRFPERTE